MLTILKKRGSNKNLNVLIKRFLPKGTDFKTVSDQQIKNIEFLINSRPRKKLGGKIFYKTFVNYGLAQSIE